MFYLVITGCKKEYSCENCNANIIVSRDSVITPAPKPWICAACTGADNYIESKWSFYNDQSFYCGKIDTAICIPDRDAFTFFGPYACSKDSGFVITISIQPHFLNKDIYNLTTYDVGCYYYDNIGRTHPFISQRGYTFTVNIDSYIHQTRMMTGRFGGIVFKPNGDATSISGKFKVRIP